MLQDEIMKLQTYKMFVGDDTVYINRDDVLEVLKQEPCEDCISRADAIKALEYNLSVETDGGLDKYRTVIKDLLNAIYNTQKKAIESLPSIQPKTEHWNNHQIACMLADLFGDACACNYNGIDEWLSELCDFKDTCCPNPVGVACWEQFLKHRAERRTDE